VVGIKVVMMPLLLGILLVSTALTFLVFVVDTHLYISPVEWHFLDYFFNVFSVCVLSWLDSLQWIGRFVDLLNFNLSDVLGNMWNRLELSLLLHWLQGCPSKFILKLDGRRWRLDVTCVLTLATVLVVHNDRHVLLDVHLPHVTFISSVKRLSHRSLHLSAAIGELTAIVTRVTWRLIAYTMMSALEVLAMWLRRTALLLRSCAWD
jgi:hypothetical protein